MFSFFVNALYQAWNCVNYHSLYICVTSSSWKDVSSSTVLQDEVPIVNFSPGGIVRCRRCRTYVNPYVTFTDGGRKWRCNICALLNDGKHKQLFAFCE